MTRIWFVAATLGVWLLAAPGVRSVSSVQRDVPFGDDPAQRLDLFTPDTKHFPTVIFVHGGSLSSGDKSDTDYGKVCEPFPAAGIGCANVDYRLMPAAAWPAPAQDVAAAIAGVRSHIAANGGNPDRLLLLGHSSGAMLVSLVGADARFLAKHQLTTATLRGVMPMGSIMWDDDLRQAIEKNGRDKIEGAFARDPRGRAFGTLAQYESQWPINYVRDGLPVYLFLIAESEQINPPVLKTNQQFVNDSVARGNQASLKVFPGRTHYSMIRQIHQPGDEVFATIVAFIQRVSATSPLSQSPPGRPSRRSALQSSRPSARAAIRCERRTRPRRRAGPRVAAARAGPRRHHGHRRHQHARRARRRRHRPGVPRAPATARLRLRLPPRAWCAATRPCHR